MLRRTPTRLTIVVPQMSSVECSRFPLPPFYGAEPTLSQPPGVSVSSEEGNPTSHARFRYRSHVLTTRNFSSAVTFQPPLPTSAPSLLISSQCSRQILPIRRTRSTGLKLIPRREITSRCGNTQRQSENGSQGRVANATRLQLGSMTTVSGPFTFQRGLEHSVETGISHENHVRPRKERENGFYLDTGEDIPMGSADVLTRFTDDTPTQFSYASHARSMSTHEDPSTEQQATVLSRSSASSHLSGYAVAHGNEMDPRSWRQTHSYHQQHQGDDDYMFGQHQGRDRDKGRGNHNGQGVEEQRSMQGTMSVTMQPSGPSTRPTLTANPTTSSNLTTATHSSNTISTTSNGATGSGSMSGAGTVASATTGKKTEKPFDLWGEWDLSGGDISASLLTSAPGTNGAGAPQKSSYSSNSAKYQQQTTKSPAMMKNVQGKPEKKRPPQQAQQPYIKGERDREMMGGYEGGDYERRGMGGPGGRGGRGKPGREGRVPEYQLKKALESQGLYSRNVSSEASYRIDDETGLSTMRPKNDYYSYLDPKTIAEKHRRNGDVLERKYAHQTGGGIVLHIELDPSQQTPSDASSPSSSSSTASSSPTTATTTTTTTTPTTPTTSSPLVASVFDVSVLPPDAQRVSVPILTPAPPTSTLSMSALMEASCQFDERGGRAAPPPTSMQSHALREALRNRSEFTNDTIFKDGQDLHYMVWSRRPLWRDKGYDGTGGFVMKDNRVMPLNMETEMGVVAPKRCIRLSNEQLSWAYYSARRVTRMYLENLLGLEPRDDPNDGPNLPTWTDSERETLINATASLFRPSYAHVDERLRDGDGLRLMEGNRLSDMHETKKETSGDNNRMNPGAGVGRGRMDREGGVGESQREVMKQQGNPKYTVGMDMYANYTQEVDTAIGNYLDGRRGDSGANSGMYSQEQVTKEESNHVQSNYFNDDAFSVMGNQGENMHHQHTDTLGHQNADYYATYDPHHQHHHGIVYGGLGCFSAYSRGYGAQIVQRFLEEVVRKLPAFEVPRMELATLPYHFQDIHSLQKTAHAARSAASHAKSRSDDDAEKHVGGSHWRERKMMRMRRVESKQKNFPPMVKYTGPPGTSYF